eukprot:scaffold119070_cov60-Phaeocystis_antarctica.AAC.1
MAQPDHRQPCRQRDLGHASLAAGWPAQRPRADLATHAALRLDTFRDRNGPQRAEAAVLVVPRLAAPAVWDARLGRRLLYALHRSASVAQASVAA